MHARLTVRREKMPEPAVTPLAFRFLARGAADPLNPALPGFGQYNDHALLQHAHPTLAVNRSGDAYEREAERVAEQVLRMDAPTPGASPAVPNGRQQVARARSADQTDVSAAPPIVHEVLGSPGQALNAGTRAFMEPRFGHDFGKVRIHTDARASASAEAVGALAYTVGRDVVFRAGQHAPGTAAGNRLLAHELAHVVQQASGLGQVAACGDYATDGRPAAAPGLRTLAPAVQPMLQRYTVPGDLECNQVADWMTANSPYSPAWAQTNCNYAYRGQLRVSSPKETDSGVSLTAKGHNRLTVALNCVMDLPQWSPTARPNRAAEVDAWNSMKATLSAHEREHRTIGQTWRAKLEGRYREIDMTVTGADRADARRQLLQEITALQEQWGAEAQADQDAIDPFNGAVLNCP